MDKLTRFLIAAVIVCLFQTGILGYIIASRASILRNGSEILLKTAPIDPRDLLRGDYVTLNYDISTISPTLVIGQQPEKSGKCELWVRLTKGEGVFWVVKEASFERLPPVEGTAVLKTLPFDVYLPITNYDLRVEYGIERYYVPEGEGKALEEARGTEALTIAARVSTDGKAQIRTLLLDGKPAYEEPLY